MLFNFTKFDVRKITFSREVDCESIKKDLIPCKKNGIKGPIENRRYINPATGEIWKRGDVRSDGKIFSQVLKKVKKDGYYLHKFCSPDAFLRRQVIKTFDKRRIYAKRKGILFDIDLDYLVDIFPKDSTCPILGEKMEWAQGCKKNSPNLDRLIPSKGYTKGNLIWISTKANLIKTDACGKEVKKVADWMIDNNL